MKNALIMMVLAAGALIVPTARTVRATRRAVTPTEGSSCELKTHCDRVLAYDWSPEAHRKVAKVLRNYGHRTHADLHADVADRLEVELRLEVERRAWARSHPVVQEIRLRRVLS